MEIELKFDISQLSAVETINYIHSKLLLSVNEMFETPRVAHSVVVIYCGYVYRYL